MDARVIGGSPRRASCSAMRSVVTRHMSLRLTRRERLTVSTATMTQRDQTDRKNWLSYLPSLPAVAAVLGLVAYAGLRYAYTRFYTPLGVLPEEVGIGYVQVLAYAGPSLIVILLVGGNLFITSVALLAFEAKRRSSSPANVDEEEVRQRRLTARKRLIVGTSLGYAVGGLGLAIVFLGATASSREEALRAGNRVEPIQLLGVEVLNVWGTPSTVFPSDMQPSAAVGALEQRCVLYLGRANGTVVLFDHTDDVVIRVPDGAVIVEELAETRCSND